MVLGIFDGFVALKDIIMPIIDFLTNGLKQLIDFIIRLPQLIHSFIVFIPEPLYTVVFSFIGLFIVVIMYRTVK